MSLMDELRQLVQDQDEMENRVFDLWTWLPSYEHAKRKWGEYAGNEQPSAALIVIEATLLLHFMLRRESEITDEMRDVFSNGNPDECDTAWIKKRYLEL